jgi:murein DD-endopeptidase MepM/ murein hydrolase activator NlpD
MAGTNLYNTKTGAKLKSGESYTDSSGRKVTQGTPVGTYGSSGGSSSKIR